jgi:hypothetical protein
MHWKAIEYSYDERSGLYRRVKTTQVTPSVVVFARAELVARLQALLPCPCVQVKTSRELSAAAATPGVLIFIEWDLLCHVDADVTHVPTVAITDDSPETLPRLVRSLDAYPWLAHCISETMLSRPIAKAHFVRLVERIVMGIEPGMLGEARVALLAQASHRDARFERIRMFFSERGVSGRTIDRINEVYEELVTNALYDAPMEAGYFDEAVPRTDDVELPRARACEISYGFDAGMAYIRVRDTFGALTRARMQSVLNRCNTSGVALDETRGGAGLGLWRVFSEATTVTITVDPQRLTEVLIGIATKEKRTAGPAALDLFFAPVASARRYLATEGHDELDQSVTLVRVA